jgi:uncharacterized delta-60 repeat protein
MKKCILLFSFLLSMTGVAQEGAIDTSFNPDDTGFATPHGYGIGGIFISELLPDGKMLVGGDFTQFKQVTKNHFARLDVDGTLDQSFIIGTGPDNVVHDLAVLPNGKIIIVGNFTTFNGIARNKIARLNADGTLDTGFNPGIGANNKIFSVSVQPDNKIIIAGLFTAYNGTSRGRIARLLADGTLDTSFNPGTGAPANIITTAIQPDGKILIGGQFNFYNGTSINKVARLNIDGSRDTTFAIGTGVVDIDGGVYAIVLLPDGKMMVGGRFQAFNGTPSNGIVRINSDGATDTGFNVTTPFSVLSLANIYSVLVLSDGKVTVGGIFSQFNNVSTRNNIIQLNADGSTDAGFDLYGIEEDASDIYTINKFPNGKIAITGHFGNYAGIMRNNSIARLSANGQLDMSYNPSTGADANVFTVLTQPDGKILIGGWFRSCNNAKASGLTRLNTDGSIDAGFNAAIVLSNYGYVNTIAVQPDGKILVAGSFTTAMQTSFYSISRLNADGSLDATFNPGTGPDGALKGIALQSDGKILVGGNFQYFNGTFRNGFARLHANGALDATYNFSLGANTRNYIDNLTIQPDEKVIVAGTFVSIPQPTQFLFHYIRLNPDATLDTGFQTLNMNNSDQVGGTTLQPDGKIIICGNSSTDAITQATQPYIKRLNANGTLDATFSATVAGVLYSGMNATVLANDGKITAVGNFHTANGQPASNIIRLNPNGSTDGTFTTTGTNRLIFDTAIQQNGQILIGGSFTSYDGVGKNGIARVNGTLLSTPDFDREDFKLYPNPATTGIHISTAMALERIEIIDLTGKILLQKNDNLDYINISQFSTGIYILQAFSGKQKKQLKFVKQ